MGEDGNLDVLGVLATEASKQHADEPPSQEVEEGQRHRRIIASPSPRCSPHDQVSEPYGAWQGLATTLVNLQLAEQGDPRSGARKLLGPALRDTGSGIEDVR
ncbi:MAG TPA: hypothetical protein VGQ24_15255 [Gemmatimonadales bacterium]|nr:hypothetical protein [Gemmatimonadales bacterium]